MDLSPLLFNPEQDLEVCFTQAGLPDKLGSGGQGLVRTPPSAVLLCPAMAAPNAHNLTNPTWYSNA